MFSIDQISVAMTDSYPPAARFIPLLLGGLKARSLRGRERNARFVWIELGRVATPLRPGICFCFLSGQPAL